MQLALTHEELSALQGWPELTARSAEVHAQVAPVQVAPAQTAPVFSPAAPAQLQHPEE